MSLWKQQLFEVCWEQKEVGPASYGLITQLSFSTTVAPGQKRFWKCQGPEKAGLTWIPSKEAITRSPWKHILSSAQNRVERQLAGRPMYTVPKLAVCGFMVLWAEEDPVLS